MTSKEHLKMIKKHYKEMIKTSNFQKYTELEEEHFKAVEKDLELLEKYRDLAREYASIQGRNLTVSIEEVVKNFRELEK